MLNRGFIALLSVILISSTLLVLTASASLGGFYLRQNLLDAEFKERGVWLAKACVEEARLKLARDLYFSGNTEMNIGEDSCTIGATSDAEGQKLFKTRAIYKNTYTVFDVSIDTGDFSIVSLEEVPNF